MFVLAIVNQWRSSLNASLRRCYPVCDESYLSARPEDWPNNGQIFILSGDELRTGQLLWCEPRQSEHYSSTSAADESQFVCRRSDWSEATTVADLLDIPGFNPLVRGVSAQVGMIPSDIIYVRSDGYVYGPYRFEGLSGDRWNIAPGDPSESVSRIPESKFRDSVKVVDWDLPLGGFAYAAPREIVVDLEGARRLAEACEDKVDCMPNEKLAGWLATITAGTLDVVDVGTWRSTAEAMSKVGPLSNSVLRQRLERARSLVNFSQTLQAFRQSLVEDFVKTPEGNELLKARLATVEADYISKHKGTWDRQLELELADLARKKLEYEASLRSLQEAHDQETQVHQEEISRLKDLTDAVNTSLSEKIEKLRTRIGELAPIWLVISKQLGVSPATHETTPRPEVTTIATIPLEAVPRSEYQYVTNERALVQYLQSEMCRRGRNIDYLSLANLYVCLKSGYLTLLAGYPGVGKSSLARMVVDVLGHHDRLLPVFVQRGWSDDRALMGYVNSLYDRYEPSTAGLVEHLLRANDDIQHSLGGLYTVLFEEMNLSPVEHYLARFISAMEAEPQHRVISLYQDGYSPTNADRYPQQVPVTENVRFIGTVNVDYTTEALSPRLLDRVNLVWMEPQHFSEVVDALPQIGPVSFEQLKAEFVKQPTSEDLERTRTDLRDVTGALTAKSDDLSSPVFISPRSVKAIATYLANSEGLMERAYAIDFQIHQRILPRLAGFGRRFEKRLEKLHQALAPYERSSARLKEILTLGSEDGEYGFFKL